ncbi:MAG: DUF433 domain-containing protein [Candidatus Omnitrophica bacterium]|nr:DUF433 domain-containing protein [Candidatus Omnitrophota bacterium]
MNISQYITVDPAIQHGKPCIIGTRTPVHIILEALATGMKVEDILREFAPISREAVQACIFYAAMLADEHELLTA